jgi:hypothetical protein
MGWHLSAGEDANLRNMDSSGITLIHNKRLNKTTLPHSAVTFQLIIKCEVQ